MSYRYELDEDERPSLGVVTALAAIEGKSPLDLRPLAEVIKPDALDSLLTGLKGGESGEMTFEYGEWVVTVTTEEVQIEALEADPDTP